VSGGFGRILPHRVAVPDANGLPTAVVVEIRSFAELANVRATNPILPTASWPTGALLPSNVPGNHFVMARFDQPLDVDSILTSAASAAGRASLTGAISVQFVGPAGTRRTLRGRAFVGGKTYGSPDPNDPTRLVLETWIEAAGLDQITALDPRAQGFPGTEGAFAGASLLADPTAFVFVPDADGVLSTHETFPAGGAIQVRLTKEVRARGGDTLASEGLASATVGVDRGTPEVRTGKAGVPFLLPLDGAQGVDPRTNVSIEFTEPLQILTLGRLDGTPAALSAAVEIAFGPPAASVAVPFTVRPRSVFDLTRLVLDPGIDLPGVGAPLDCADFSGVRVRVNAHALADLVANVNTRAVSSAFQTGAGPGLVNAPVTPDTIYVARSNAISVVDLNGYGAGTGNPTFDPAHPIVEGNSNYPNNPNVALQGAIMIPPLAPGTCTFDGGSAGVFTLTKDSNLSDRLVDAPLLRSVGDMALGHALDVVFNASPFACTAGGVNLCASTGLKRAALVAGGPNTVASGNTSSVLPFKIVVGGENLASWAPHPNPPPLVFPPLCQAPLIQGQEPSSIINVRRPPDGPGLTNLLVPGSFPLGIPAIELPPQGLLTPEQNAFFEGPGTPQPSILACPSYAMRQQIGQFLYAIDREAEEIVVLNSNRFFVLERVPVPDPTSLAMSPNLDLLAISSEATDRVLFLDVDPASATFHQIVRTVDVGDGPRGIAWESGNEDVFVCCTGDGSVHVISAFTLAVRKVLTTDLDRPIDVALTPRQTTFGFLRGVYFAYILDAVGHVTVFESGPNGVNGLGFDEVIGRLSFPFFRPKAIQPDISQLSSGFYVLHENPLDANGSPTGEVGGAVTRVALSGGPVGVVPLAPGELPSFRGLEFSVVNSLGEGPDGLSGVPVDLAFDDLRNLSALTNFSTQFSAGQPLSINGKSLAKFLGGTTLAGSAPAFLFVAVPQPGVLDVFELSSGTLGRVDTNAFQAGLQSIPAPGVSGLMNYFRQ